MSTWSSYEEATEAGSELEPLVINKGKPNEETFTFPAQAPGDFGMELMLLVKKYKDQDLPDEETLSLLPLLIGEDNVERLRKVASFDQIMAIIDDLLVAYKFAKRRGEPVDPPTTPEESTSPELSLTASDS